MGMNALTGTIIGLVAIAIALAVLVLWRDRARSAHLTTEERRIRQVLAAHDRQVMTGPVAGQVMPWSEASRSYNDPGAGF